jgi:hypothetical protein
MHARVRRGEDAHGDSPPYVPQPTKVSHCSLASVRADVCSDCCAIRCARARTPQLRSRVRPRRSAPAGTGGYRTAACGSHPGVPPRHRLDARRDRSCLGGRRLADGRRRGSGGTADFRGPGVVPATTGPARGAGAVPADWVRIPMVVGSWSPNAPRFAGAYGGHAWCSPTPDTCAAARVEADRSTIPRRCRCWASNGPCVSLC